MLAQNFKSAADLKLSDQEQRALVTVLGMLERDEIRYHEACDRGEYGGIPKTAPAAFNMSHFFAAADCGTVACIGGWAVLVGNLDRRIIDKRFDIPGLGDLFDPYCALGAGRIHNITTSQAATALRSYLTTGDARWDLAVA